MESVKVATFKELVAGGPANRPIIDGIDALGHRSAEAQGLKGPLTSLEIIEKNQQTLYVAFTDEKAIGILKLGKKHLYYSKAKGGFLELDALCVLDFYVDTQRQGIGIQLFQWMLQREGIEPCRLAYDRPSPKLLPFLKKHFELEKYVIQPYHYVIFDSYFD